MMWKLFFLFVVVSAMSLSDAERSSRKRRGYAGGYAGGYASSGSGAGGYSGGGHYGYDYDDYGDYAGPYVGAGFIDPYAFHQQLTNQILAQHQATQNAITALATSGDAYVTGEASIDSVDDPRIHSQIAAQQAYADNIHRQNRYRPSGVGASSFNLHRYAPSYALAAGSIGPSGHHQTAYINPANPATPNIVNRFGGSSSGGGGGFKGVSVSSFSSSNSDGTNRRGAQTTINDNGKVTSYSVHS